MTKVNVQEAKTQLSGLLEQAAAGEGIIIAKAGKSMAPLVRIEEAPATRKPGAWKGKIWMAPHFDELPEDIASAFRGEKP